MRDDDAYSEFVAARWSTLFRLAYLLAASRPAAEDLLQTSLMKTYVNWSKVSRLESPEAYVRKIMVNTLISERRLLRWRRERPQGYLPDVLVESSVGGVLDHALLWPIICALPERQRAVIVLRYYEDLSEADIATVLGCAVGTVKSNAHDAINALRRGLGAAGIAQPQPSAGSQS